MSKKLRTSQIAPLFNWTHVHMHELAQADKIPLVTSESFRISSLQDEFTYEDALMIEVARQLHDDDGISMEAASKLTVNAGVAEFLARPPGLPRSEDFWIGIARNRNTWGGGPRGSWPVTNFGPTEYWSSAHFSGTLETIAREMREFFELEGRDHSDSDPALIILANVSAADRRLRKRAAEMKIDLA